MVRKLSWILTGMALSLAGCGNKDTELATYGVVDGQPYCVVDDRDETVTNMRECSDLFVLSKSVMIEVDDWILRDLGDADAANGDMAELVRDAWDLYPTRFEDAMHFVGVSREETEIVGVVLLKDDGNGRVEAKVYDGSDCASGTPGSGFTINKACGRSQTAWLVKAPLTDAMRSAVDQAVTSVVK